MTYNLDYDYIQVEYFTNDTHVYVYILDSIRDFYVCVKYVEYRENIYLYLVHETYSPQAGYTTVTVTTTVATSTLSNKTILRFILWLSSIVLVITALHKLDIYV